MFVITNKYQIFKDAMDNAFKHQRVKDGTVRFKCPICGGQAEGIKQENRMHLMCKGEGCVRCGVHKGE